MRWLIAYLFWLNVATFAMMAVDRHNAYYGLKRLPKWLYIIMACIGGIYGYLMALWLFDHRKKTGNKAVSVPWGYKDQPYRHSDPNPFDDSPVPGWGGSTIHRPGFPAPGDNIPLPSNPDNNDVVLPSEEGGYRIIGNEIIVLLNSNNPLSDMAHFVERFHQLYPQTDLYKVAYYNTTTRMMRLLVPTAERQRVMECIEQELSGELNFLLTDNYALAHNMASSSDSCCTDIQKYLNMIQASAAWDVTQGSSDVTVAVVDTYFALDHPALSGRWRDPINIVTQTRNVLPPAGEKNNHVNHGSHVAGIAIGNDQETGIRGMAPRCSWIPISVGKSIYTLNVLEGVLYAIYKGADVVNLSLGAVFDKEILRLPINKQIVLAGNTSKRLEAVWNYVNRLADERKCVIVWAGGNENSLIGLDAAKRDNTTIKVSAVDGQGRKAIFSNHGNYPKYQSAYSTLSAPGTDILSCVGNKEYTRWDGTSMAAPFVAGAVALMKSLDRSLSPHEIITILTETGRPTRAEEHIGPVIQIKDALLRVRQGLIHFDDAIRDRQILLGNWEATQHLIMTNSKGEYLDDILLFFYFQTQSEGELTLRSVNAGNIYRAAISLSFGKNQLNIVQNEDARCVRPGINPIRVYKYECKADENGLLLCTARENGVVKFSFHLRKSSK